MPMVIFTRASFRIIYQMVRVSIHGEMVPNSKGNSLKAL